MLTGLVLCLLVAGVAASPVPAAPQLRAVNDANCGQTLVSPSSDRIVGGSAAYLGEYPWMVNILYLGLYHICGGSIIDSTTVLCAAHCLGNSQNPAAYTMLIGNTNSAVTEPGEQRMSVASITVHAAYNQFIIINDIAIFKLATPINFDGNPYVNTVCLPTTNPYNTDNLQGYIMGWGDLVNVTGNNLPTQLQKAQQVIQTDTWCSSRWGNTYRVPYHTCAWSATQATCVGDSGGPLNIIPADGSTNGGHLQVGIVSFGSSQGCLSQVFPSVYTRVANYLQWLSDQGVSI